MQPTNKSKLTINLDWKYVSLVLVVLLAIAVYMWKPWEGTTTTRKITVTGQATVKETPDEYVLSPYFEFTNADKAKATAELTAQSSAITAKLKELGVKEEQIKSNTSSYDKYTVSGTDPNQSVMLSYTITLDNKDLAQKVQDYMVGIKAKGQLSPQATFSEAKKKQLQAQAREKAIIDAKSNAETTAKQLDAKVGKVITISDGATMPDGPIAVSAMGMATMDAKLESGSISTLPVQVGQDEFRYSVSVEYELK